MSATEPADDALFEMTLGSYPAAFIWDETLLLATDDAECALLLACDTALESDALRTLLALDALWLASLVKEVYDAPALSLAEVAAEKAQSPAAPADLLICDGATPCLCSSLETDLLACDDADKALLLASAKADDRDAAAEAEYNDALRLAATDALERLADALAAADDALEAARSPADDALA